MPQGETKTWKIGKERPGRNPILAERTPRRNFIGWEFRPPPAAEDPPRWHEPEQAMSILDMLSSQQKKINAERKWKQESDERIRLFEESVQKEKMLQLNMSPGSFGQDSTLVKVSSADNAGQGSNMETGRTFTSQNVETARSKKSTARYTRQELLDIPVSHMKSLQKTCPAVLSNYRAQRAQKFIQTVADPDPRAPRKKEEEYRISFRPPGKLTRYLTDEDREKLNNHTRKKNTNVRPKPPPILTPIPRSEADLLAELKKLTAALENTNEEIERQTLKIALAKKVKTFDKKSTA